MKVLQWLKQNRVDVTRLVGIFIYIAGACKGTKWLAMTGLLILLIPVSVSLWNRYKSKWSKDVSSSDSPKST